LTELSGVELPDERFRSNLISIAEGSVLGTPFSTHVLLGSVYGNRHAWRLFSRGDLNLLSTHQQNSLEVVAGHQIVAVEDTTDLLQAKCKKGLGSLGNEDTKVEYAHQYVTQRAGRASAYFIKISRHPVQLIKQSAIKFPIELKEL
jgi:hypothetical protein